MAVLSHLNVDIICGSNLALSMPINSAIIYSRLDDFSLTFHNQLFFKFLNIMEFLGDVSKMGGVQKCRPRMSPITSLVAHNYSKQEKLGPVD